MFINLFGLDIFLNLFCLIPLTASMLAAILFDSWLLFFAARLKPEQLSRDGVISNIVLLMTQMLYYYSWTKKTTPKKSCTIVRVVTEGDR